MPSFGSAPIATSSAAASHNGTVRATIISYARAILPSSLPAAFYDFVPFILAGMMALLFTALLVLLVEDSEDVYPHSPRSTSNGLKASKGRSSDRKGRIVGLAEHHQEELDEEQEDWDRNAWNPRADLANANNTRQSQQWLRIQQEKSLANINPTLASYPYRTSPRLLATPPSSAPPDSPAFSPPILSMAKMIMHRHDQYSKRSRSPSRASPPPSPPSSGGNGSFKSMQYTLKSASLRSDKLALVAFPSTPEEPIPELIPLPPSRSPSPPTSPSAVTTSSSHLPLSPGASEHSKTSSHTRASSHSRSRAVVFSPALDSLALPSVKNLSPSISSLKDMAPSLPSFRAITPALQMLGSQKSQDRTIRRQPSGLLEEGSSTHLEFQGNDTITPSSSSTSHSHASNSRKPKRRSRKTSHKRSGQLSPDSFTFPLERTEAMHSNDATKKRGSDLLADLEEGSHGRAR